MKYYLIIKKNEEWKFQESGWNWKVLGEVTQSQKDKNDIFSLIWNANLMFICR